MSMQTERDPRFELGRHYRLRRALEFSGIGVGEMAEYLEVNPYTVSNWINGRGFPRRRDLRGFAMKTGFPIDWLERGDEPADGPHGGGSHLRESNSRPIHYSVKGSRGRPPILLYPPPDLSNVALFPPAEWFEAA